MLFDLGATYPVHKDQAFLIYPGDRVYYEADWDDPWHYDWIAFSGNGIEECVTQMGFNEKRYVITVKRTHELSDCVTKILNTRRQTLTNELLRTAELLRFFAMGAASSASTPARAPGATSRGAYSQPSSPRSVFQYRLVNHPISRIPQMKMRSKTQYMQP